MSRTLLFRSAPAKTREAKSSAPGVEAIAAGAILAAGDRKPNCHLNDRNVFLVGRFSEKISESALPKPARDPKICRFSMTVELPAGSVTKRLHREFSAFPSANGGFDKPSSQADKGALFKRFMEWHGANPTLTARN